MAAACSRTSPLVSDLAAGDTGVVNALELVDYLAAGAALVAGVWIGRRSRRGSDPMRPVCTCGHGYGHHAGGHQCAHQHKVRLNGVQALEPCGCQLYDGPVPAIFGLQSR